jgi:hypothetical protein
MRRGRLSYIALFGVKKCDIGPKYTYYFGGIQ